MTVKVVIVYPNNVRAEAGRATTLMGIKRHAYGGGKTPFGHAHDGVELWRAEVEGTARALYLVGATCSDNGVFTIETGRGHILPCKVIP